MGNADEERAKTIERAAERLRELKASGVEPSQILAGEAGATFVRDYCEGDPEVAAAAFAFVHSPSGRRHEQHHRARPLHHVDLSPNIEDLVHLGYAPPSHGVYPFPGG